MFRETLPRSRTRRVTAALCLSLALLLASAAPAAGCSWDYPIWMPRDKEVDALYRFIRGDKAGYIDRSGSVVIEPKFDFYGNHGGEFREGVMEVEFMSGRYVDGDGKEVEPAPFRGREPAEGLAAALDEETDEQGYVDRAGEFVISPRFCRGCNAYPFSDGLAWVKTSDGYGFIDRSGEFVVEPTFLHADSFSEGMARVVVEGPCALYDDRPCSGFNVLGGIGRATEETPPCKFTFVERNGSLLKQRFDGAKKFSEGLAPVSKGNKWGYINKSGRLVVEPRFDDAWPFSGGRARVRQGELYGFIDERGKLIVPARFGYAADFAEGLAPVGRWDEEEGVHDDFHYIDGDGRTAIPGPFRVASHFFKGLAHVKLKRAEEVEGRAGPYAYIDAKGKTVFAYEVGPEED